MPRVTATISQHGSALDMDGKPVHRPPSFLFIAAEFDLRGTKGGTKRCGQHQRSFKSQVTGLDANRSLRSNMIIHGMTSAKLNALVPEAAMPRDSSLGLSDMAV